MATKTQKRLEFHKNCRRNSKCCVKHPDLEYVNSFHPPLIGASSDFCKDALAKGIPISRCTLAKPERLEITATPHPEEPLPTNRYRKNWERWCRIWKHNQEKLTAIRNRDTNPPLMACTEADWYKQEDAELFDRTLHSFHLTGFNIQTADHPPCLNKIYASEIRETILPRHRRCYSEMKRYRYAETIRDELGLRKMCPSPEDIPPGRFPDPTRPTGRNYDWNQPCNRSKYLATVQSMEPCDLPDTGFLTPYPYNLILQNQSETMYKPKAFRESIAPDPALLPPNIHIPDVTVTRFSLAEDNNNLGKMFDDRQPPVLQVVGCRTEIHLTYVRPETMHSYDEEIPLNKNFFIEELDTFYSTTRGKDTRHITIKNEGATAIRYLWLRFPPTKEMMNLLRNPSKVSENISFYTSILKRGGGNGLDEVHKASNLEFRFRELPGVILTGQKIDFPIIFRTQKPGYYNETLYLITHPQLQDLQGRTYAVRMTGICIDPELNDVKDNPINAQNIKDRVTEMIMEQGAADAVAAIIDSAVFKQTQVVHNTTLPFGKVTSESVFYAHNKDLTYHYGVAEKTLDLVRKILQLLIPKENIEWSENVCELSIRRLYRLLLDPHVSQFIYANHLKSDHAETSLKTLSEHTNKLVQPRRFTYPSKEDRIGAACTASSLGLVQEIVTAMGQVEALFERPALKQMIGSLNSLPVSSTPNTGRALARDAGLTEEVTPEDTRELGAGGDTFSDGNASKKSGESGEVETPMNEPDAVDQEQKKVELETLQGEKSAEVEEIRPEAVTPIQQTLDGKVKEDTKPETIILVTPVGGTNENEETTEIMNTTNLKPSEGNPQNNVRPTTPALPEGINNFDYVDRNKKAKIAQAKRIVIEDLLGSAIDRIICVVDAVKAAEDYKPSNFMVNPNLSCCDQPLG